MNIDKIINKLNIELNVMQQATVDALLNGTDDIVLLSPTGSGKTLSYLLPLSQLVDASSDEVQAVVVVPGRELALQSANVLKDMGSGLRGMACYGGRPTMDEHRKLREVKPQIIFATPGRLNDHLDKLNIVADYIKYLVIDEFDARLHPLISKRIVELFNSAGNKSAQLIFVTHDTNLLSADLLRRDQIDFVEKDK